MSNNNHANQGIKNDYYANDPHNPGNLVRRGSDFSQTHRSDSDGVTRNTSIRSILTSTASGDAVAPPTVNLPPVLIPAIVRQTSFGQHSSPTKVYQYDSRTNYYDDDDDEMTSGLEATFSSATAVEPAESTGSDMKKQPQVAQTIPGDQAGDDGGGRGVCGLFGKKKKDNQPKKQVEAVGYWQLYRFASKRDWFYVA